MIDWLLSKTFGWVLGLIAFALIWPIYKSGFWVRQGVAYKKNLRQVDQQISKARTEGHAAGPSADYFKLKKKSTAMIAIPLVGIAALFVILVVYTSWMAALTVVALAGIGFINVS